MIFGTLYIEVKVYLQNKQEKLMKLRVNTDANNMFVYSKQINKQLVYVHTLAVKKTILQHPVIDFSKITVTEATLT